MIGRLKGLIVDKLEPGRFVIDVQGVGYDVETSLNTFFALQDEEKEIEIHIHTVVREDALLLYGFANRLERALFRSLIRINGVGPKLAISILSSISPQDFIEVIQSGDTASLVKLPGIGKKTAERLLIEMRDSIESIQLTPGSQSQMSHHHTNHKEEAISALLALGYKNSEAKKAISQLDDGEKNSEQLIRQALQLISSR